MQLLQDGMQRMEEAGEAQIMPEDDENYAAEYEPGERDPDDAQNPNQAMVEGPTMPAGFSPEWMEDLAARHGADFGEDDDATAAYQGMRAEMRHALGWGLEEDP